MRTTSGLIGLLLLGISVNGASVLASAQTPVAQAWAARIDGPTDHSLVLSGMDVGPSGDVFLVGPFRSGGFYLRDILITRRTSSSGATGWCTTTVRRRVGRPAWRSASMRPGTSACWPQKAPTEI